MSQMGNREPSGELMPVLSDLSGAIAEYIQSR
jgi:hypothetical protein